MSPAFDRCASNGGQPLGLGLLGQEVISRVYEVARWTAVEYAQLVSANLGRKVLLKREDQQPGFSFKLRGAYNKMVTLDPTRRARGVIAASAGNHVQGVALGAARLGIPATIVMPHGVSQAKIEAIQRFGGASVQIVRAGSSHAEAHSDALRLQAINGQAFIPAFDDADVIAGQATVGAEILDQCRGPLHAVFVPAGSGGLLAGVSGQIKSQRPDVKVIGVQSVHSDALTQSLIAGRPVAPRDRGASSASGAEFNRIGQLTLSLCRCHVDAMMLVDTDEICAAIRDIYQEVRCMAEPSGALALAGLKRYAALHPGVDESSALLAIVSGANMNFDYLSSVVSRAKAYDVACAMGQAGAGHGAGGYIALRGDSLRATAGVADVENDERKGVVAAA